MVSSSLIVVNVVISSIWKCCWEKEECRVFLRVMMFRGMFCESLLVVWCSGLVSVFGVF